MVLATISAIFHIFLLGPSLFFAIFPLIHGPGYFIILQIWSLINICASTLLAFIHFLPQIYYTWTLERVESLSIPTMIMQVPTYFLLAASLAVRFGTPGETALVNYLIGVNAWVNYLVAGCEQGILLGLSIYFVYGMPGKDRLPAEENEHEDAGDRPNSFPDEQTPLLSNEPSGALS